MKTIKITLITLIAVCSLVSCKKDSKEKTTAEKIQAKWSLVSIVDNETVTGGATPTSFTQMGKVGEYIQFKNDGKVYIKNDGEAEQVVPYTVNNDTQLTLDGDPYTISVLTENSLVIYMKKNFTGGYYESTISLSK